jgi:hypothetical protein
MVPLLFHGDRMVEKARILAPILRSIKNRLEVQVRHYQAWRMLLAEGLTKEESIHLAIDESSPVNKPAVLRLIERLAAFQGFAPVNIPESRHFECQCRTCTERARTHKNWDLFVQPGYWLAASILRSGSDFEDVFEALMEWGGFGERDPWHECYVPDETLNHVRSHEERLNDEKADEEQYKYWFREGMDDLEGGSVGMLFGEEEEEEEEEEAVECIDAMSPNGSDKIKHIEDLAQHRYIEIETGDEISTNIDDRTTASEQLVDHKLTLCPTSARTDPCPEHCPSRRRRLRDNIHNSKYSSCTYHCHNSHAHFEYEQSGEQVGFWLPHGLQSSRARAKWAATTMNRMERIETAWNSLFEDDGLGGGLVAEVKLCVAEFLRTEDGDDVETGRQANLM